MSREKHKVTKLISPDNTPSENYHLARFGEFANTPAFLAAFFWRLNLTVLKYPKKCRDGTEDAERARLIEEIGKEVAHAVEVGDWRYLERLAKATKFVNERFDWKIKTPDDLIYLFRFDASKFLKPVDQLRMLIIREYFLSHGYINDKNMDDIKKSRKAFMEHIESMMSDAVCEKTFDRACRSVGIRWRK
jgi:hypothetical protein